MHVIYSLLFLVTGSFKVVNFRDSTTESDLRNQTIKFDFEFDPLTHVNTSLGFELFLGWNHVNGTGRRGVAAANCTNYQQTNAQLERVGQTGTYRLSVPLYFLGEGRLLVKLTISLSCLSYRSLYRYYRYRQYDCGCNEWQISGFSDSLEINAKQG